MNARHFIGVVPLIIAVIPIAALARDCNEVKAEIDAKITAKGVTNYFLEIVDAPNVKEGKIVGICNGGEKQIVYRRGAPVAPDNGPSKKSPLEPDKRVLEEKPTGTVNCALADIADGPWDRGCP
jgi:hypothetical protein